jgi:CRP-like cAMP-binding protein
MEWTGLFTVINFYRIVRLLIERRPVHFTPDEARLRELSFPSLTPREARDLYAMGVWDNVASEMSLVKHDHDSDRFSVILRGDADVLYRKTTISQLGEGQFVGQLGLHADKFGDLVVLTRTAMRVMCWPRDKLQAFLEKRPDVALALERSVSFEVWRTLGKTLTKLSGPDNPTSQG